MGAAGEVGAPQALLLQMAGEIPGVVWSTDSDLRFTSSWGAGLGDLSLRPNQVVGMTLFEYFGTDDPEFRVIAAHRRALEGETVAWKQDWQGKTYQTRVAPLRDHEGRIAGCTGIAQDVTHLKRAETALRESGEKWRSLVQNAANMIIIVNRDSTIQFINRTPPGFRVEQVVGESIYGHIRREYHHVVRETIEQVLETGEPGSYQIVGDGPHGRDAWYDTQVGPIRHEDQTIAVTLIATDITERKRAEDALRQSERRARALLNAPADAMFLIDVSGRVVEANETWARAMKRPARELVGTCVFDQFPPHLAKLKRKQIAEVARTGKPAHFEDEYEGRIIESTVYPIFDQARKVIQIAVSARDVTEWKRAQEELRESERRYRAIVEDQSEFICRFRPDGTIAFVNAAVSRVLGKSPQELIGADFLPYVHPDDREDVQRRLAALTPESALESHENRNVLPGGDVRYGQWVNRGIFGPEGNLTEIQAVGRDITDRVRAEQSLQESQERYHAIFEQAVDSILLVDPDTGAFLEFNDRAHQSRGYTREEFERLTIPDIEVTESAEEVAGHLNEIVRHGSDSFETKHRTKAGEIRDIQVNSKTITVCGRKIVQSIWHDITDRVRTEEALKHAHDELERRVQARTAALQAANRQLRLEIAERERAERQLRLLSSAVAQSKEGVAVSDLDGRLLFANESFAAMHGYRAEEVVGEHLSIFHVPEQIAAVEAANRQIHERGHFHGEIWHARRDGTVFPSMMHSSLLHDQAGRPTGMIGTMRDISDRKRTEEALRESEKRRAGAEKLAATGRLAARVAHEINNPLAGIANCFRLVKAAVPPDHRHYKFTEIIEKEIDRIGRIVRQMFQVHRPDQETVRDVRVAETIGEVVAILEPNCRERRVRVETHADPAEMTIKIPEGSLRQILYNLLANAIEASPPDGVVRVAASAAEADDTIQITVADQGGGIPQAVQDRIFEPFFTTKESDTSGGLGLGLPISKGIVDSLRGSLDFQTEPGGTTFRLVLPAATN